MSHNITLKNAIVKDLRLLGRIVKDLSKGEARLTMDAITFRTFPGQPNRCDAAIIMPGQHDIGLVKTADKKGYNPVFDDYALSPMFKALNSRNYVGLLMQEYALREGEIEAARLGMSSTRVPGKNGTVTLELIAA